MFTPTSVEQRVRIAVSLLTAQNAGRQVTREQLADHLKDVEEPEIEDALGRLQAAGAIHVQGRAIVPRVPPFAGRALPPVVPDASRWSGDSAGRAQPASDG